MKMNFNVNFYLEYHNTISSSSPLRQACFSLTSYIRESFNFTNENDHLLYLIIFQVKTVTPKEVSFTHVNSANTF